MSWQIDRRHSYVGFEVKHMMVALVRGRFTRYDGRIDINRNDLTRSTFVGEIEATSIDTHEPERDRHLRSVDFFDVERFPLITFRSTMIEAQGGNLFNVTGDITIHGVTRPILLEGYWAGEPRKDPWGQLRTGISAAGTLNRKDFGLTWNRFLEGGGVLAGDEVRVQVDIELTWQDAPGPASEAAPGATRPAAAPAVRRPPPGFRPV